MGPDGTSDNCLFLPPCRFRAAQRLSLGSLELASAEHDGLEPIETDDTLRLYVDHEETEYCKNTVHAHRSRLQYFVQWCEEVGVK